MTTTFDRSLTSSSPGGCKLHIHRPISSRTAFGHILAIPFRYAWYDHTLCTKPSERSWMRKPSRICLAEMEKPLTRKLGTLASMKCDDGAYIYAQSTSIKWQTSLHLHPSPLPFFKPMLISNDRDVETTIELLLIAERHADPGAVARLDAQMWRESWDGEICKGKERYDERTWDVEGTLEGMTLFVDKFTALAPSHPALLLNRLHLCLIGSHPTDVLSALLHRLYNTYARTVTSHAQIIPYDPRPPPAWGTLVTLAMYEGAVGHVTVCLAEEMPKFGMLVDEDGRGWYRRADIRSGEAAFRGRRMGG